VDAPLHREIAVATYNRCWELLERDRRSPDDDAELLTLAFTSRYHWSFVGGLEQTTCADWMVSRAAASQNLGSLAVLYAQRAYEAATTSSVADWLLASTAEGLARAYAASGDQVRRDEWCDIAATLVEAIADPEDRDLIATQLASVPSAAPRG